MTAVAVRPRPATGPSWTGRAWSCAVRLVVTEPAVLTAAVDHLQQRLDDVDRAASRFRADSDLSRANAGAGRPTPVTPLLLDLVEAALDAAARSHGAVDPTLGLDLRRLGYDRDIADVRSADRPAPTGAGRPPRRRAGWREVRMQRSTGRLTVPAGTALDLGATAKAWTADTVAGEIADRFGIGVLVELGGDVAVAGRREGGWRVRVAERAGGRGENVTLTHGGIATSTTTLRTWGRGAHHIIDPATGQPTRGPWRTVSVWAADACTANAASTAAIVHGSAALGRLIAAGVAARLVRRDGLVVATPGWPAVTP